MISQEIIASAVRRLVTVANPNKIVLFGSYARGDATDDSDLDFLVVEPAISNKLEEMVRLRSAIGSVGVGVDVLVCSEEEVARRGQVPGTAIYWALKEGKVLYDASQ